MNNPPPGGHQYPQGYQQGYGNYNQQQATLMQQQQAAMQQQQQGATWPGYQGQPQYPPNYQQPMMPQPARTSPQAMMSPPMAAGQQPGQQPGYPVQQQQPVPEPNSKKRRLDMETATPGAPAPVPTQAPAQSQQPVSAPARTVTPTPAGTSTGAGELAAAAPAPVAVPAPAAAGPSAPAAPPSFSMPPPAPRKRSEDDAWVLPKRGVAYALHAAGLDKDFKLETGPAGAELHNALMELYGTLIENAVQFGCTNARMRKSQVLKPRDMAVYLERTWNIHVPGFAGEQLRPHRRPAASELHKKRLLASRQTQNEAAAANEAGAPGGQ